MLLLTFLLHFTLITRFLLQTLGYTSWLLLLRLFPCFTSILSFPWSCSKAGLHFFPGSPTHLLLSPAIISLQTSPCPPVWLHPPHWAPHPRSNPAVLSDATAASQIQWVQTAPHLPQPFPSSEVLLDIAAPFTQTRILNRSQLFPFPNSLHPVHQLSPFYVFSSMSWSISPPFLFHDHHPNHCCHSPILLQVTDNGFPCLWFSLLYLCTLLKSQTTSPDWLHAAQSKKRSLDLNFLNFPSQNMKLTEMRRWHTGNSFEWNNSFYTIVNLAVNLNMCCPTW